MIIRTENSRLRWIHISVCVFLALGMFMSPTLWHSQRLFPLCPVFNGIPAFPEGLDTIFPFVTLGFLFVGALLNKRWSTIIGCTLLLLLLLQDQLRWQPWVYLYASLLVPFLWRKLKPENHLFYVQILLIGVYFWSGVHKIGPGFNEGTFDRMLGALFFIDDPESRAQFHFLGYLIPLFEILIAVGFLFRKTRSLACIGALLTHTIILTYLIVEQHNSVVYPWNVAMVVLVALTFWKSKNYLSLSALSERSSKVLIGGATVFYLFLPALNFVGLWDNYLSFKLYSGSTGQFCVRIGANYAGKVDPKLQAYFWTVEEPEDSYWIYLSAWAFDELNVPFYPEERVFRQLGAHFCAGDVPSEELELVRFMKDFSVERAVRFGCEECE